MPDMNMPPDVDSRVALPTMREGESREEFGLRTERELVDLLEGMNVEEAPLIKRKLKELDEQTGQPAYLDALERFYEGERLNDPDNQLLERLSVTSRTVADIASLIAISTVTPTDDPARARAVAAVGDKLTDDVALKTSPQTYSALGIIVEEALKIQGPPSRPE